MRCIIKKCKSYHNKRGGEVSFHMFPVNEIKRQKWIDALHCKPEDLRKPDRAVVCSLHFRDKDFIHGANRRKIMPSAVPFISADLLRVDEIEVQSEFLEKQETSSKAFENKQLECDDPLESDNTSLIDSSVVSLKNQNNSHLITKKQINSRASKQNLSALKQINELERQLSDLRQIVVDRDRTIKVLNTKLRLKSGKISKLLKIVTYLKTNKAFKK